MLWSGIPGPCHRYQQPGRTVRLDGLIHVEHVESLREKEGLGDIDSSKRFTPTKITPDVIDHDIVHHRFTRVQGPTDTGLWNLQVESDGFI